MKNVPYLKEKTIEQDAELLLAEFALARNIVIEPPIPIEDIVEKHLKLGFEFDDIHRRFDIPRRRPERDEDPDILGFINFDKKQIVIDESLDPDNYPAKEGRYRFTLAHEGGGHWRLHRHQFARGARQTSILNRQDAPSIICRTDQAKERVEWQADYYASCLLMPSKLVRDAWRRMHGADEPFVMSEMTKPSSATLAREPGFVHIGEVTPDIFEDVTHYVFKEVSRLVAQRYDIPVASMQKKFAQENSEWVFNEISRLFAPTFGVSVQAMQIRLENLGLLLRETPVQIRFAEVKEAPLFEKYVK